MSNNNYIVSNSGGGGGGMWSSSSISPAPPTFTGEVTANDYKLHDGTSIVEKIKVIEARLAILGSGDPVKIEQYTALKDAFDHYKFLEALLHG